MDKKQIQSILEDAVEHELPSKQINLIAAVKADLVSGTVLQGQKMQDTHSRHIRRLAFTLLIIMTLMVVTLVSPQGRALAQTILRFFRRSDSHVLSLPSGQVDSFVPTPKQSMPLLSVSEAEKSAGFDAKELASIPAGFTFVGAATGGGGISITYQAQGGELLVNESKSGFMQSDWDRSPVEAITEVKINGIDGEFVQGAYVVYPNASVVTWNPEAPVLRLRWVEDGIWFELAKFGGTESIAYLDKAGMIALAESMVYAPGKDQSLRAQSPTLPIETQTPVSEPDHVLLAAIADAVKAADFDVKVLPAVPQGFVFRGATATQGSINMEYESEEKGAGILSITESISGENWLDFPADAITPVRIGNTNAELIRGAYVRMPGAASETWNANVNMVHLRWVENGIWFEILMTGGGTGSLAQFDQDGLIALAETLQ